MALTLIEIADEMAAIGNEIGAATADRPVLPVRLETLGELLLSAGDLGAFDKVADRDLKVHLVGMRAKRSEWGKIWAFTWNHLVRVRAISSPKKDDNAGWCQSCHAIAAYIRKAQSPLTALIRASESPAPVTAPASKPRRGRLKREDSKAKETTMLALIVQHPTLMDDVPELSKRVGVGITTVRRWMNKEREKYRQSKAAMPRSRK